MNTSAFISAIVVALASYAAAMPVPDEDTGAGGKAGVSFPFQISHISGCHQEAGSNRPYSPGFATDFRTLTFLDRAALVVAVSTRTYLTLEIFQWSPMYQHATVLL